ncbi:MAG: PEP-CTERM sorting domain-containing protein [Luteolibacter sp.]|jgi:hypothetical protein|nr:PEP-CTERM sorting domain-containing protein [Luteolibacter sp.]
MKTIFSLVSSLVLGSLAGASAQSVFYTPQSRTPLAIATGDPSVWDITVTGGGIAPGQYDAWCFSPEDAGYGAEDFGQSFESTLITLNGIIHYQAEPGVNMAGAMVNYVFDTYFGFWNESGLPSEQVQERYLGFHHILWEIQRDYHPEIGIASFDLLSGDHIGGSSYTKDLISGDLANVYAGLSPTYTSSQYDIKVIDGRNVLKNGAEVGWTLQPLIVVSVIPEPSTLILGGLAAGMLALRRRRGMEG